MKHPHKKAGGVQISCAGEREEREDYSGHDHYQQPSE
jgi:hypothetical protein